ncbi:MAG TPA: hypothetical protein VKM37_00260 [Balneolaceae bacterium]|nr:hypothetical protein [Balneolaceae bacterium]
MSHAFFKCSIVFMSDYKILEYSPKLHIPDDFGHRFRFISATNSG